MINVRWILRWTRRAVLILMLVLFVMSLFTVLAVENGPLGMASDRIVSTNGVMISIRTQSVVQPKDRKPWQMKFAWLSDEERRGITYRGAFNPATLGFRMTSQRYQVQISGSWSYVTSFIVGIPYWPILLLLLMPEIGPALRRARARVIRNMPQAQPQRVEASTIVNEMPCVHCGYNLQTLATTGLCPECGSAIVDTLTLSAELARSRPSWLKCLAAGNAMLILTRLLLIAIFIQYMSYPKNNLMVGLCAVAAAALYMIGTILLTLNEHPFLRSSDRTSALRQRIGAIIVFACIAAALYHQKYMPSGGRWSIRLLSPWFMWSGYGFWHFWTILLLLGGWLLYCVCTIVEYRFLGKLAGRLLDRFMTEHCIIAGIGAGITNLAALWITRDFESGAYAHANLPYFCLVAAIIILWVLFQIWTGFMNVYCASRFLQQAWLAEENWRSREMGSPIVQP